MIFNLLVRGFVAAVRVVLGAQFSSSLGHFYADDLEVAVDDLQVALDWLDSEVVFHFGDWTNRVRCCGVWLRCSVLPLSVYFAGAPWFVVSVFPYLGVVLIPSFSWTRSTCGVTWRRLVQAPPVAEQLLGDQNSASRLFLPFACSLLRFVVGGDSCWLVAGFSRRIRLPRFRWLDVEHFTTGRLGTVRGGGPKIDLMFTGQKWFLVKRHRQKFSFSGVFFQFL